VTSVVTLTTDFGVEDAYVAAMKGVLLTRCPEARLVDLCHAVPPQDIRAGALRLAAAAPYFPAGTVHLVVVDPGVGSARRAIAVSAHSHFFVGPDNGVLSLAADSGSPAWRAVELTNRAYWQPIVSTTFHGRDVFAPVAAHLACGGQIDDLGPWLDEIEQLQLPRVTGGVDEIRGVVLDVDRFGNLVTNIRSADLGERPIRDVTAGSAQIMGLSDRYDPAARLVALFNSDGWLEVAAPGGSAARHLRLGVGAPVRVRFAV